jgi:hypothetical protein
VAQCMGGGSSWARGGRARWRSNARRVVGYFRSFGWSIVIDLLQCWHVICVASGAPQLARKRAEG